MVNKVKLEIRCVGPRDLGQPGDGLGGQLNDGQVEGVGLGQTVVTEVVAKPGVKSTQLENLSRSDLTKSALPRYSGSSVAHVSIHKSHDSQDATHLGVGVSGHHLEYVVVEFIQEGIEVLLADLPQLRGHIGVQVLGSFVPDTLTFGL